MTNWKLKLRNIGGFLNEKEFILKDGLNLVIGNNATGKTTLINSLKLLNNFHTDSDYDEKEEKRRSFNNFLNDKTGSGYVNLENTDKEYFNFISSQIKKITSYLNIEKKNKVPKKKRNFISKNSDVLNFAFIDKENKLMEDVEYSGSLEKIKDKVLKISKIKHYENILNRIKKINLGYFETKEKELERLNDERKDSGLKIRDNKEKMEKIEVKLNNLEFNDEVAEDYTLLQNEKKKKNQQYNQIYYNEYEKLSGNLAKTNVLIEKNKLKLDSLEKKHIEIQTFHNLEDNIFRNEEKIKDYDSQLKKIKEDNKKVRKEKTIFNVQINTLKETLNNNETEPICNHCLNKIDTKKINEKLDFLNEKKDKLLLKLHENTKLIDGITRKRNNINDLIVNQKNIPKRIATLSKEIETLKKRIYNHNKKKSQLLNEIKEKKEILDNLKITIKNLDEKLIDLSDYDDDLKIKQTELLTEFNLLKEKNEKLTEIKGKCVKKILILPEKYNKLLKRTELIIKILDKHIENFYFEFIDLINTNLETLFKTLKWNFSKIYVDDNLNLKVENSNGKPIEFLNLSGFERKSIAILILLIIKIEYFPEYPIFTIDEHLNSADPQRFLNFFNLLFEIIKDKIDLFIITSLPFKNKMDLLKSYECQEYDSITLYYKN